MHLDEEATFEWLRDRRSRAPMPHDVSPSGVPHRRLGLRAQASPLGGLARPPGRECFTAARVALLSEDMGQRADRPQTLMTASASVPLALAPSRGALRVAVRGSL